MPGGEAGADGGLALLADVAVGGVEIIIARLQKAVRLEVVQLQFNYLDFDDPKVQSRACYEVCVKHNKPVIVMEPAGPLPPLGPVVDTGKQLRDGDGHGAAVHAVAAGCTGGLSPAGAALRFCASFPNVRMILSGMGSMEMMEDRAAAMAWSR